MSYYDSICGNKLSSVCIDILLTTFTLGIPTEIDFMSLAHKLQTSQDLADTEFFACGTTLHLDVMDGSLDFFGSNCSDTVLE